MKRISCVGLAVLATLALSVSAASAAPTLGYHPSSLLVTFDPTATAAERAAVHGAVGSRVATRFSELGVDVVSLPDGLDPVAAEARYERHAAVVRASLNHRVQLLSSPNDTLFKDQWGFNNTGQAVTGSLVTRRVAGFDINGPEAWDTAFGAGAFESSGGARVAVLDTGIDRAHVEFLNKVAACASALTGLGIVTNGTCSDDNLHGTHTAGTVGALTNNGIGVAGTAPNASLAIFKFLDAAGFGFVADGIAGVRWAHNTAGAKVISMSYGAYEATDEERQALADAWNAGILPVAAAGNDYDDTKNYPGAYPEVFAVASTNQSDDISDFSNCYSEVDIAAPGEDVWSTFPSNTYGVISGTSMATPHVAGAAALVISEKGYSGSQARQTLESTARDVTGDNGRTLCAGLEQIDLAAALGGGGGSTEPPPPEGPGAIAGKVFDQKTKAALASASVDCGSGGSAVTGSDGRYSIADVPAATYTCTASTSGYKSKSASVIVSSGNTTTADFALQKAR